MRRLAPFVVLVLLAGPARAEKSRAVAQYLSAGGAAASSVLVLGALLGAPQGEIANEPLLYTGLATSVITPSIGEWYAGQWWTWGMAVRAAAAAFGITALATQQETVACEDSSAYGQTCHELTGPGLALAGVAAIAYIGGVAYDVITAPDAVDHYNSSHFMVTPAVLPSPSGAVPGVYFSATY